MAQWPSVITTEFWSFAVKHAINIHNCTPQKDQQHCPYTLFTGEEPCQHPDDFRVFGCPVYVLDPVLQDGNALPKWDSRCYQGVYVGHSPHHASNVVLVYNPKTKLVSPQYHIFFDEGFQTTNDNLKTNETTESAIMKVIADEFDNDSFWYHSMHDTEDEATKYKYFDRSWDLAVKKDIPLIQQEKQKISNRQKRLEARQQRIMSKYHTNITENETNNDNTSEVPANLPIVSQETNDTVTTGKCKRSEAGSASFVRTGQQRRMEGLANPTASFTEAATSNLGSNVPNSCHESHNFSSSPAVTHGMSQSPAPIQSHEPPPVSTNNSGIMSSRIVPDSHDLSMSSLPDKSNEIPVTSPYALLSQFTSLTSSLSTKKQKTDTGNISTANEGDALFKH
jgi:hypothetical protein